MNLETRMTTHQSAQSPLVEYAEEGPIDSNPEPLHGAELYAGLTAPSAPLRHRACASATYTNGNLDCWIEPPA